MPSRRRKRVTLHTATIAVTVCAVVNIVAASLITLVLSEHTRLLQFRKLNANVEAKGQSEDITDSHKAVPSDHQSDQSTLLPDASTNERESGNSSAFDPVVVLKMMTVDSLSPSFTSVDSQHSVQVGNPAESPTAPADSSTQSQPLPATSRHVPRHKTKRSPKLAANNKHEHKGKSSKHGVSEKQTVINDSGVIHDARRLQKPKKRA